MAKSELFLLKTLKIRPSIFFTRFFTFWVTGELVPISIGHCATGVVHPEQVTSSSQNHTETTKTNDHCLLLERIYIVFNLTRMFLVYGRKPEYSWKINE